MMDDLSSPVEAGLILYDGVEQALVDGPARWLAPLLGACLLIAGVALLLMLAGPTSLRIDAAAPWRWLHLAVAPVSVALGLGLLSRQSWAVVVLLPALLLLQWIPAALFHGALVGGAVTGGLLLAVALVEAAGLVLLAGAILLRPGR